jgi:hypothetical protein
VQAPEFPVAPLWLPDVDLTHSPESRKVPKAPADAGLPVMRWNRDEVAMEAKDGPVPRRFDLQGPEPTGGIEAREADGSRWIRPRGDAMAGRMVQAVHPPRAFGLAERFVRGSPALREILVRHEQAWG